MNIFEEILTLVRKDFKIEFRKRLEIYLLLLFSIISGAIIGFVTRVHIITEPSLVCGMIILVQLFLSVFASWKSFIKELEKGTLNGILLTPISPSALFYSKLIFSLMIIETTTLVTLISIQFFSGGYVRFSGSLLIGTMTLGLYLSAVASFSSVVGIYVESKGLIVPLVNFVLSLPASLYFISSIDYTIGIYFLLIISFAYGFVITSIVDFILGENN